ncbi:MAG: hypothetical protein JWQ74_1703 [Marmoricola sp.]|nr:hypothetical protein [Marmoricola sp.]
MGAVDDETSRAELACRWFGVRGQVERVGTERLVLRTLWALLTGSLLLWIFDDVEPKRFADVVVYRRDTGQPVASFAYDRFGEGVFHRADLDERLRTTQVFDFCGELDLGIENVQGPGVDREPTGGDPWTEITARERAWTQDAFVRHSG